MKKIPHVLTCNEHINKESGGPPQSLLCLRVCDGGHRISMRTSKLNCFKKRYSGDSCEWKNNGPLEEYVTFILLFPPELEDGFPSNATKPSRWN